MPNVLWIIMLQQKYVQKKKAQKCPNKNATHPCIARQPRGCSSSVNTSLQKVMVIKFPVSQTIQSFQDIQVGGDFKLYAMNIIKPSLYTACTVLVFFLKVQPRPTKLVCNQLLFFHTALTFRFSWIIMHVAKHASSFENTPTKFGPHWVIHCKVLCVHTNY